MPKNAKNNEIVNEISAPQTKLEDVAEKILANEISTEIPAADVSGEVELEDEEIAEAEIVKSKKMDKGILPKEVYTEVTTKLAELAEVFGKHGYECSKDRIVGQWGLLTKIQKKHGKGSIAADKKVADLVAALRQMLPSEQLALILAAAKLDG